MKQKYLQGAMITLALLIFATCGSKEQKQTKDVVREQTKGTVHKQAVPKTISIYRYGDFSLSTTQRLEKQLKSYFSADHRIS